MYKEMRIHDLVHLIGLQAFINAIETRTPLSRETAESSNPINMAKRNPNSHLRVFKCFCLPHGVNLHFCEGAHLRFSNFMASK
jgi:hypothetical protein